MSSISFTKMQAQGNDFVILDGRKQALPDLTEEFVRTITERRYGIGCDQLLILFTDKNANARMRIFNNDGSEAANCGNGLRCVGQLLLDETNATNVHIALADRTVLVTRSEFGISVAMGGARVEDQTSAHVDINIGNQHRVFFEATEEFPTDRNIEIITGQIADHVYIDIIERGAGRTLACGSGACAAAAAIWHVDGHTNPQTIEMPGGEVRVSGSLDDIRLEGPASKVFEGAYFNG